MTTIHPAHLPRSHLELACQQMDIAIMIAVAPSTTTRGTERDGAGRGLPPPHSKKHDRSMPCGKEACHLSIHHAKTI
ncbi:MAG: hypothetical protein SOU51_05850 [Collinsella sp.]|nr:hypothetical protein [Collinsella sp.]